MALSMDEQRMLAEIERRLAAEDPRLASCLTTFRRPGPGPVLRSPRARIIGSLFTVLLVAMVSLTVYAMIPFRAHAPLRNSPAFTPSAGLSSASGTQSPGTQQASASASTSIKSSAKASIPNSSAVRSSSLASGTAQEPRTSQGNPGASHSAKP